MQKEDGGAWLRKLSLQNLALGGKLSWKMYKCPNKLWSKIFQKKYLDSGDPQHIFTIVDTYRGSPTWNFLWSSRGIITSHISWKIGNGNKAKF